MCNLCTSVTLICGAIPALADPSHGIAMYGDPALPPDFVSLPYANPDAPKGGSITFGESGSYDSLNPFIQKGNPAAGVAALTVETLMGRNIDEPFSLYGLLAESIDVGPNREWVEFTLRPEARFSDGTPVTVADVMFSFELLGTRGNARYASAWKSVLGMAQTDARSVRFMLDGANREMPLILGLRPVLQKAQWDGKPFEDMVMNPVTGSGPYVVAAHDMGRSITFRRNPDWWGKDLPINRGLHNLDQVKFEYFTDANVIFEAFKAGLLTVYRESNAAKWLTGYDFNSITSGAVVKSEIPRKSPSGINGLAFNTRRAMFADWRVREALITAFDFETINATLNGGTEPRITSYFSNSALGMTPGAPATGGTLALLQPFADSLLPGAIDGYALPVSDGTPANRRNLRAATKLLAEAGWTITDGILRNAEGTAFDFEIMLPIGASDLIAAASIYVESLKRLGITARIATVDSAQYTQRTGAYDFDMTNYIRALSLSPGNEQTLYWGSAGVTEPGTRNWPGVNSPAAEAMIRAMLAARDPQDFRDATEALDRVLTTGRYVIPIWFSNVSRVAHDKTLHFPQHIPVYGDWPGFLPDTWWYEKQEQ